MITTFITKTNRKSTYFHFCEHNPRLANECLLEPRPLLNGTAPILAASRECELALKHRLGWPGRGRGRPWERPLSTPEDTSAATAKLVEKAERESTSDRGHFMCNTSNLLSSLLLNSDVFWPKGFLVKAPDIKKVVADLALAWPGYTKFTKQRPVVPI